MSSVSDSKKENPTSPKVPRRTVCVVEACESECATERAYCNKHYMRLFRYGSTDERVKNPNPTWADVSGERFGLLVAQSYDRSTGEWTFLCDCGETRTSPIWNIRNAAGMVACGKTKHYEDRTPLPSYTLAHGRVRLIKGRAKDHICPCGKPGQQWAYDHKDPDEFFVPAGYTKNPMPYSMKPEHYVSMCIKCHKRFDLDYLASRV